MSRFDVSCWIPATMLASCWIRAAMISNVLTHRAWSRFCSFFSASVHPRHPLMYVSINLTAAEASSKVWEARPKEKKILRSEEISPGRVSSEPRGGRLALYNREAPE